MKVLPWPGPALRTSMVPPCRSTTDFTIVRPIPSPADPSTCERSACVNMSKIVSRAVCGIPTPSSVTEIAISSPSRQAVSEMVPPEGV